MTVLAHLWPLAGLAIYLAGDFLRNGAPTYRNKEHPHGNGPR